MIRLLFLSLLTLASCKNDPYSEYEEVDLLKFGMPVEILAPVEAEVGKDDLGIIQGAWIKADGYYVQIYASNATTFDLEKLLENKRKEVMLNTYFSEIVEEDDHGFLYKKDIDGNIRYDFRHYEIIGDKEYTFQKGLIGNYTEEEVRSMYEAIKAS